MTTKAARVHIRSLRKINSQWRQLGRGQQPVYAYTLLRPNASAHVYLPHWSEVGMAKWCEAAKHEFRHVLEGTFHY